jgi:hypothetical protein
MASLDGSHTLEVVSQHVEAAVLALLVGLRLGCFRKWTWLGVANG